MAQQHLFLDNTGKAFENCAKPTNGVFGSMYLICMGVVNIDLCK